ncbi:MAG: hypothetical protein K2N09_07200 [Muribaculaceae bacterium]|nr:hypothetical protein [Muribaculaceae bacterium]
MKPLIRFMAMAIAGMTMTACINDNTLRFADTEAVKVNREKNKTRWETFVRYLDSKGKLTK